MVMARCPQCEATVMFDGDTSPGEIVSCPDCGLDLEVKGMQGREVELQILPIEREDWGE